MKKNFSNSAQDTQGNVSASISEKRSLVQKRHARRSLSVTGEDLSGLAKKEGILKKQSRRGRWQKRFFSVNNAYLNYYHIGNSGRVSPNVAGTINLCEATIICILSRNGVTGRKIAIQTQGPTCHQNECYFLLADSAVAAASWVAALNNRRFFFKGARAESIEIETQLLSIHSKKSGDTKSSDESDDDDYITGEEEDETSGDESADACTKNSKEFSSYRCITKNTALPEQNWGQADAKHIKVRSASYLTDRVKIPGSTPLFTLLAVDNFSTTKRIDHICSYPANRVHRELSSNKNAPFLFVFHLQIPGPPFFSFVLYFGASPEAQRMLFDKNFQSSDTRAPKFTELARKFFLGDDDEFRNQRFKFLPHIVEGPYVVRKFVPSRPALIGRKLKTTYHRTDRYLELDLDIGSSVVAWKSTQLALGYAKLLLVDLGLVLEGVEVDELPEQVIGMARIKHVAFLKMCEPFDENNS